MLVIFICSYGFHKNHCLEALEYTNGDVEDALYILYSKYFNAEVSKPANHDLSEKELMEQRTDEKSSLESIYGNAFCEKVKNSVWIVTLQLNYLINRFHKKDLVIKKVEEVSTSKKKEKCKGFARGYCRYGDKCRFSHEEKKAEKNINAHIEQFDFELEIRFHGNTRYPYEPPLIFLKGRAVIPPLVKLHICKKLYDEAKLLAEDGIPSVYSIVELVQNEEEILNHLNTEPNFINKNELLFPPVNNNNNKILRPSHYKKGMTNRDNKRVLSEKEIIEEDERISKSFISRMNDVKYIKMLQTRKNLPAWNHMSAILQTVRNSQVVVISGETGCGKSTQVPQYILDDWLANYRNDKTHVEIVCTQPRRISALGVAERVADERIDKIGNVVGYQIRLESKLSNSTRLTFCTTGILLRRLESDPTLPSVTHVIVDEVHERSVERSVHSFKVR